MLSPANAAFRFSSVWCPFNDAIRLSMFSKKRGRGERPTSRLGIWSVGGERQQFRIVLIDRVVNVAPQVWRARASPLETGSVAFRTNADDDLDAVDLTP